MTLNVQLFVNDHQWLDIISLLRANGGHPRPMSLISPTSAASCKRLDICSFLQSAMARQASEPALASKLEELFPTGFNACFHQFFQVAINQWLGYCSSKTWIIKAREPSLASLGDQGVEVSWWYHCPTWADQVREPPGEGICQ